MPRTKKSTIWAVAAILPWAWCGFEYLALKGSPLLNQLVDINQKLTLSVPVTESHQTHYVQIATSHAITITVYDPEGARVVSHRDPYSNKKLRRLKFTPESSGDYTISVMRNSRMKYAGKLPTPLSVRVNDRRLFTYRVDQIFTTLLDRSS